MMFTMLNTQNFLNVTWVFVFAFLMSQPCLFFFFFKLFFVCAGSSRLHRLLSSCGGWGLLYVAMRGLLFAVAPLVAEHRLQVCGLQEHSGSVVAVPEL